MRPASGPEVERKLRGRVRGQGETPDWIRQLFGFAKKGNLERLVREQLTVYITNYFLSSPPCYGLVSVFLEIFISM